LSFFPFAICAYSLKNPIEKNMKKTNQFSLIDGGFTPDQAKDLLTELYTSKIKYHSVRALRHEEKFAEKSTFHAERVNELKLERDRIIGFLLTINPNERLNIESIIKVSTIES
jgi:DNA-directed RNA polymerase subunit F